MKHFLLPIKFEAIVYKKSPSEIEVLALKRSEADGGFWQPVTGTLETNESLEECIYRELEEETGIKRSAIANVSDCFFSFTWDKKGVLFNEYVFGVEVSPTTAVHISEEHTEHQWLSPTNAMKVFEKENNKKALATFADLILKK